MNIKEFIRANTVPEERFIRFNEFDPDRMDYTIQVQTPSGETVTYRNPKEADDGNLTEKHHNIIPGSKLLAFGTACWDWLSRNMVELGIDIDTGDNHKNGLSAEEFGKTLDAVQRVPWVKLRRSSGGEGLHAFAQFSRPVAIRTRAEAAALARAVLTLASREVNFDLQAAKDCAGSNIWIYKASAASNAFEIIKEATSSLNPDDLPPGWRETNEVDPIGWTAFGVE